MSKRFRRTRTPRAARLALGLLAAAAVTPARALPAYTGNSQVSAGGQAPVVATAGTNMTVDLRAARTILDWSSFNISNGETVTFAFDQRNWIAFNRVSGGASIDGALRAINAPAPGAGPTGGAVWVYSPSGVAFGPNARVDVGGLLATSSLPDTTAFLNAGNINIPFTGSGSGGSVTAAAGAQFNATAYIALVAPKVTTAAGSTTTVSDYGTALYGAADSYEIQFFPTFNNDLTLFTFIVPNGAAGTPQALPLDIRGATTSGTIYLAAYSRAQLASQVINAPGLLTARSSIAAYGQVTITSGRSILLGQVGAGSEAQQVQGVAVGSATVGQVNADGNVNIYLTGTGGLGDFRADSVRSGQNLLLAAQNITVGPGGLTSGDAGVNARNLTIDSAGTVNVPLINSAQDLFIGRNAAQTGRTTAAPILQLGTVVSGRNTLVAAQNIRATSFRSGGDLNLSANNNLIANDLIGTGPVAVRVGNFTNLVNISGASFTLDALNSQLGSVAVTGDVLLRVGAVGLTTSLTATNLTIEVAGGNFVIGGTNPGELADEEIQRIKVSNAFSIYGGLTAPTVNVPNPVYGDLLIKNVTFDPAKIPKFYFYADNQHAVRIVGPTNTVGDPSGFVRIGDPTPGSKWAPKLVTFSDGSDPVDFSKVGAAEVLKDSRVVEIYASGDILIGSQRFIDLVTPVPGDQIDLARGLPTGVAPTPDEVDRAFLSAGQLTLAAGGRILVQNTSSRPDLQIGLVVSGKGVPTDQPILTLGRAQTIDVFGAIISPTLGVISGQQLASSNRVGRLAGDAATASVRVNGCLLGTGCGVATPATQFRIEEFTPAAPAPALTAVDPPVISAPPLPDEDDDDAESVVTGTGNEEIWRKEP